jgi:hypothetical protein
MENNCCKQRWKIVTTINFKLILVVINTLKRKCYCKPNFLVENIWRKQGFVRKKYGSMKNKQDVLGIDSFIISGSLFSRSRNYLLLSDLMFHRRHLGVLGRILSKEKRKKERVEVPNMISYIVMYSLTSFYNTRTEESLMMFSSVTSVVRVCRRNWLKECFSCVSLPF